MRILFTRFPLESANGGAENQTMWLAEGLRKRGHEVSFLGSCPVLLQRFSELSALSSQLVIGSPPVTKWAAMSFLWRRKKMQRALITSIEALPKLPEVLVMLSLSEKILLTPWAAKKGIRVLWVEHDRIGSWLTKNPWLRELKTASDHATIICVSELSRSKYIDVGFDKERVVCIYNGVPLPDINHSSPLPDSHYFVGSIARLSPEKGIDVLVHAVASLPEILLTIVGTGREESYLRRLAEEDARRIGAKRISFWPHVTDIDTFYASIDAFVLPSSDHDPFGLVAAEAMTRGIATIVTDACGIASLLTHGKDALIAKAGSAEDLAACLRQLKDPLLRETIATAGKQTIRHHCSIDAMTQSYEKLMR